MKYNFDLYEILEKIYEQVKHGKMEIVNISCEPHLQPRYLTDDLEETKKKDKLEYYEYNITFRKYNLGDKENE